MLSSFLFSHNAKVLCKTHITKKEKRQVLIEFQIPLLFLQAFPVGSLTQHQVTMLFVIPTQRNLLPSRDQISTFNWVIMQITN